MKSVSYHFNAGHVHMRASCHARAHKRAARTRGVRAEAAGRSACGACWTGSSRGAADLFEPASAMPGDASCTPRRVLVPLSFAQFNGHQFASGSSFYQRMLSHAPHAARTAATALSQALSMRVLLNLCSVTGWTSKLRAALPSQQDHELPLCLLCSDRPCSMRSCWWGTECL